jgi:hypothetical protein
VSLVNIYVDSLKSGVNSFNVGQTIYTYDHRHRNSDYGKAKQTLAQTKDQYINYAWWTNVSTRDDGKDAGHDKIIHSWLDTLPGMKRIGAKNSETFEFDPKFYNLEIIVQMIYEKFFSGKEKVYTEFKPRPYQQKFLQKIASAWNVSEEFLLFAKCRAGKSAMVLKHIVDSNYKLSLVCSRQRSPEASWENDSNEFFPTIKYISVQDPSWETYLEYWMERDVNIVLWGTVQSFITRIDRIHNIDFVAFDEAHIGGTAKQFTTLRNKIKSRICYISGTAHKLCWMFPDERQKFVYTYFDEQFDVQNGVFKRPKMNIAFAKYQTSAYQEIFGDDPDAMKNIFTMEDDKFLYEILVREFIHKYFGPQREIRIGDRLLRGTYHMMALPSVKACHAFQKLVHCYYPSLVVTSDTNKDQDDINRFLEENSKALIITQSANVLGVTAKKIDTVINCKGGESIEFWTQFAFRGGSGVHDWWVIDFDAQRCLRAIHTAFQLACDNNPALSQYSVVDFTNIHEWNDGFKELSKELFEDALAADVEGSISTITSIVESLDLSKISDFNLKLKTDLSTVMKESQLNDEGANNKSCIVRETERVKKSNDLDTLKKQTVKALLESIPLTMFYIIRNGQNVYSINDVIGSAVYPSVTGDCEGILDDVISKNPHSIELLTRRIGIVSNSIQKSIRNSVSHTINELSVSSQIQQSIPVELFDLMIDNCNDLSNVYMFGDPSGSHTARLLERQVDPNNITVWESCNSHRNRVKYINDSINIVDSHPDMKFTAILANPPYNDPTKKAKNNKLWPIVVEQHLELVAPGGDICEVTPSSVLGTTGKGKKFMKLFSTKYNLKMIDYTADDYFTEGVAICRWHLTNEPYQGKTTVITHDGSFTWDLRDGLPLVGDSALKHSILNKIANSNHPRIPLKMGQAIAKEDHIPDGKYEIYHSSKKVKRTNIVPTTGDVLKFIVPFSSTYKNGGIFTSSGFVGMFNCWCPITSEEEGDRLSKIFDNKIIQFFIDNYKKTAGFTPAIKNGEVPDITDYANLSDQFGFTEEEVEYLKKNNAI